MNRRNHKIYIAGHRGMVGSAIRRRLEAKGCKNLICRSHGELDLMRQQDVEDFFEKERPEFVSCVRQRSGAYWPTVLIRPSLFMKI